MNKLCFGAEIFCVKTGMEGLLKFYALLNAWDIPVFWVKLVAGFLLSYLITFFTIPTIIKISRRKNLMDEPGLRSSHLRKIPNLGGIAIFYAIAISASIFAFELFDLYKFLFAAIIVLLFVGVMDDIVVMRAYKKLVAQLVVATVMVIGSDVRIRSFFGFMGITELNYWVSVAFSIFTFIALINAFNLIDGIDGLAGGYSLLCSIFFGLSYFRLGSFNYPLVVFCATIVGSLLAFLYYNLSNYRTNKIFMGDTGSMILGFLLAFTALSFIDLFIVKEISGRPHYHLRSAPAMAVAILIIPIIDTLNVMIVRLSKGQSILNPDKNHIHHKLLALGFSHRRSTFFILVYYLLTVLLAYCIRHSNINIIIAIILAVGFFGAYLPDIYRRFWLKYVPSKQKNTPV